MKINSIVFCGILLTACNCVSKVESIAAGTDSSTSDFSNSTSTDTDTGIFTSTEYSTSNSTSNESSTTAFISDLNFVESSSSGSSAGESLSKCNDSESGECKVFITSMSTFPSIGNKGFDNFCTEIACGSNFECDSYQALIRKDGNFWGPFENFNGQYVLPSGKVIASGTDSLQFASSINENEAGVTVSNKTAVWTGFSGLSNSCFNFNSPWETSDPQQFADSGYVGGEEVNSWYTGNMISCNSTAHVICVEVVKK